MAYTINTADNDVKGAVVEGFIPNAGTALNLSIGAGFIDGREVLADTSVTVTAATTDNRGYLISEDGAGAFVVTMGADDAGTAAQALVSAGLIDVPAGDVAIFIGVVDTTTTVGELKDSSVKGQLPDITADF